MKAGCGFVIAWRQPVHGRARPFTRRQRTPSGTSVELAGGNWFQQGATHVYGYWFRRDHRYGVRLDQDSAEAEVGGRRRPLSLSRGAAAPRTSASAKRDGGRLFRISRAR